MDAFQINCPACTTLRATTVYTSSSEVLRITLHASPHIMLRLPACFPVLQISTIPPLPKSINPHPTIPSPSHPSSNHLITPGHLLPTFFTAPSPILPLRRPSPIVIPLPNLTSPFSSPFPLRSLTVPSPLPAAGVSEPTISERA